MVIHNISSDEINYDKLFISSYCETEMSHNFYPGPSGHDVINILTLNGLHYFVSKLRQQINWSEAWSYCKGYNAKLVKIESRELQQRLESELLKHGDFDYWTAGYWSEHKQKSFIWNNGETIWLSDQKL